MLINFDPVSRSNRRFGRVIPAISHNSELAIITKDISHSLQVNFQCSCLIAIHYDRELRISVVLYRCRQRHILVLNESMLT